MRNGARSRLAACAVLSVLLFLAGCGGGDDPPAAPASTPAPAQVDVSAPENGATVRAKREFGNRLWGEVEVRGTTEPGVRLVISATCRSEIDCLTAASAGPDGRFSADVEVWSDPGGKQGHLEVGAEGSAPIDRPRLTVLLVAAKKAPPKPASTGKKKKTKRKTESTPEPQPESEPTPPPAEPVAPVVPAPPETSGGGGRSVVLIGDSLAQGIEPYLGGFLGGSTLTVDARRGRPLAEGMGVLGRTQVPSGPVALAFSLFTNDSPSAVGALESAVRTSVQRAGPNGCAVWATIARPPHKGVSYAAANQHLNALASEFGGRLLIVPWAETVAGSPSLLGRDRVHATAAGYRLRAQLYADAVRSCRR
jgi:hypothetical protein